MADVRVKPGIAPDDLEALLAWANAGGADFLKQFAGPRWRYPLTAEQVGAEAGRFWSIFADGRFAGIVQEISRDAGGVRIGRFALDPAQRGAGIGASALAQLCRRLFEDESVEAVTLRVYRFNAPAIRCYRKCGFAFSEPDNGGDPWDSLEMALRREDLRQ